MKRQETDITHGAKPTETPSPMLAVQPGTYRHYKGNLYRVHYVALHSETLEPFVCYETLYANEKSRFWVRPQAMFLETVTVGGKPAPRFVRIG